MEEMIRKRDQDRIEISDHITGNGSLRERDWEHLGRNRPRHWQKTKDNKRRARFGRDAVKANPDWKENGPYENVVDQITNLLHYAASLGNGPYPVDPLNALAQAWGHFVTEAKGEE